MTKRKTPRCCIVYITAKNFREAQRIGKILVEERLAACANVFDRIRSMYWWKGAFCDETEASLIVKTRSRLAARLIRRVKQVHSYDCPCIVCVPITSGNPGFLRWICEETRAPKK
jgi:periplasmic divalent cation tolerance protein